MRGNEMIEQAGQWVSKKTMTNLELVLLKLGGLRLLEGDSHSGDGVVVGTALERREDGTVDPLDYVGGGDP